MEPLPGAGGRTHEAGALDPTDVAAARGAAPRWFTIGDTADLTEGGRTRKLDDNLAAIRLLKTLQRDGRPANGDEQAVFAR